MVEWSKAIYSLWLCNQSVSIVMTTLTEAGEIIIISGWRSIKTIINDRDCVLLLIMSMSNNCGTVM